jgi:putative methyltransferase (TIGR04325 family)
MTNGLQRRGIAFAAAVAPPIASDAHRWMRRALLRQSPEWEYVPDGWGAMERIRGWDVDGPGLVAERNWSNILRDLRGPLPFGTPRSDGNVANLSVHNMIMSYAYALARASRQKDAISILDWGGGLGYYRLLSQHLFPDVAIDYHCKDVPSVVARARSLQPDAYFYADDSPLGRGYDLVIASASLHYVPDWRSLLDRLAKAADGYLYLARQPIVSQTASFVFIQRAYPYGYDTEYLGWCLNRRDLLDAVAGTGLTLVREFASLERPHIHKAPEACDFRSYLFARSPH